MDVSLILVRENGDTNAVKVKRTRMLIGRRPECEIRIPTPQVSREHAEIRLDKGRLVVRDLGSSNGTYVDGKRVQEADLAAGSILTVGPATFLVRIDGQPASIDPTDILRRAASLAQAVGAVAQPLAPAAPARPDAPAKPATSKANGTPAPAAAPKKAAPQKAADDSDSDFDFDEDDSSLGNIDFSDLLKDDDDEKSQPKL